MHRELITNKFILPYVSDFDDVCWWESQFILWAMAYVMYPNHILMFEHLYWHNPEHSPYPRDWKNGRKQSLSFVKSKMNEVFANDLVYDVFLKELSEIEQYAFTG